MNFEHYGTMFDLPMEPAACRSGIHWNGQGKKNGFSYRERVLYFCVFHRLFCVYNKPLVSPVIQTYLALSFSFISLIMVLKSFVERHQATLSWILIIMSHFWIALSIAFNDQFTFDQIHIYLSGIAVPGILGLVCLRWLKFHEDDIDLDGSRSLLSASENRIGVFGRMPGCFGLPHFPDIYRRRLDLYAYSCRPGSACNSNINKFYCWRAFHHADLCSHFYGTARKIYLWDGVQIVLTTQK